MPARWTLTLFAERPDTGRAVSPAQLHGLAATLLEGAGADHRAQNKPYAITPLMATGEPGTATLRIGWLQDTPRPDLSLLIGQQVRLGAQFFTVTDDAAEEFTPYGALRELQPARRAVFGFCSVTYFSRSGRWYPLPDPVLLYGGLTRRWNLFAPPYAQVSEADEKALLSAVALSAYDTASQVADLGAGRRIGFTGNAVYTLTGDHADHTTASLFSALTLFAAASGVGAQTTHGLGAVEAELAG